MNFLKYSLLLFIVSTQVQPVTAQTGNFATREGIRYLDLVKSGRTQEITVDRDDHIKLSYPSAIVTMNGRREMIVTYVKLGPEPQLLLKRSTNGGLQWGEREILKMGGAQTTRVITLLGMDRRNPAQLMLFSGAGIFRQSLSTDYGHSWSDFVPINGFGGFRITDSYRKRSGEQVALFHDDGRFIAQSDSLSMYKPIIYQISSEDGINWSLPQIMVKHNIYGLVDATVARHTRRNKSTLVMIASEPTSKAALVSFSEDEGENWSYPVELPTVLHGDRHRIWFRNGKAYVVFRDTRGLNHRNTVNNTFGDLMMWVGNLSDLQNGSKGDYLLRIADNYPSSVMDPDDINTIDCGYASILPSGKGRLAVIAYGQWEKGYPAFIKCFIVDVANLSRQDK